jgi:hypothetical protein
MYNFVEMERIAKYENAKDYEIPYSLRFITILTSVFLLLSCLIAWDKPGTIIVVILILAPYIYSGVVCVKKEGASSTLIFDKMLLFMTFILICLIYGLTTYKINNLHPYDPIAQNRSDTLILTVLSGLFAIGSIVYLFTQYKLALEYEKNIPSLESQSRFEMLINYFNNANPKNDPELFTYIDLQEGRNITTLAKVLEDHMIIRKSQKGPKYFQFIPLDQFSISVSEPRLRTKLLNATLTIIEQTNYIQISTDDYEKYLHLSGRKS